MKARSAKFQIAESIKRMSNRSSSPLELSPDRRAELIARLRSAYASELDETLSDFRAETLLDMVLEAIGPSVYNQAVKDAQAFMQSRLDDLDGEIHLAED